jgi:molybdenum cofactor cytidylyltransferase
MMADRAGRVAGVVLAAGTSSRLGSNKLLLELGAETVVRRAARHALEAGLSPVIVVLGYEALQVAAALAGLPLETVVNPEYAAGMHASVRAGMGRVPADCDAALVLLSDMPLVTPGMIAGVVARHRAGAELVISLYGEVQAPPTLYARRLFPALAAAGPGAGRRVIRDYRSDAVEVHWRPELLADLDLPGDLERLRAILALPTSQR